MKPKRVWRRRRAIPIRIPPHIPFLLPFAFLVTLFFFVPVVLNILLAFTDMDFAMHWDFVGLKNYFRFFTDRIIPKVLLNTVIYVPATLAINVGLGLVLGILSTYYVPENVGLLFRAIWLLPRMTPPVVYALLWLWVLDPTEYGLLNMLIGQNVNWTMQHPLGVVIIVNGMVGASFGMIIFSAAVKSIPRDYIMAAQVDGASNWQIVRRIIIPLLRWPLMFVTSWQTLSLLASYEYILLVTDGGPFYKSEVWSLYAYHTAFSHQLYGYGAAIAMILVIVAIVVTMIMLKIFGFRRLMELVGGG